MIDTQNIRTSNVNPPKGEYKPRHAAELFGTDCWWDVPSKGLCPIHEALNNMSVEEKAALAETD